jgi:microcompartment protein CcmL/EutN
MQALGLIETRGLLAAIVCADVMLKSAQVELLERTLVGGGLVTISVTGDVGAVKAAVEAGAAAVEQLDRAALVSRHVIPRPHNEIDGIVVTGPNSPQNQQVPASPQEDEGTSSANEPQVDSLGAVPDKAEEAEALESDETVAETTAEAVEENPDKTAAETTAEVVEENPDETEVEVTADSGQTASSRLHKDKIDELIRQSGIEKSMEFLQSQSVVKLRRLAREYSELDLKGRAVSKAGKELLFKTFKKHYEKHTQQDLQRE